MEDIAVGDAFMLNGNFFAVLLVQPDRVVVRSEYGIHASLSVHMATALSREFSDAFGSGSTR